MELLQTDLDLFDFFFSALLKILNKIDDFIYEFGEKIL